MRCNIPEAPEVRLTVENTRKIVDGKYILHSAPLANSRYANKAPPGYVEFASSDNSNANLKIESVNCHGKFIYWKFSNDFYLLNTMGMTGQWSNKQGNHACFYFVFTDQSYIYFNDPRHFGTIKFGTKEDVDAKLNNLGWDAFTGLTDQWLTWITQKLKGSKKTICEDLMNQSIFSGVGNYIKSESLYLSKLSPWRKSNSLSSDEIKKLCLDIIEIVNTSYQHQGATIQTYKTAYGEEGKYSSCFKVYGKKGDPLGNKIIKETTPDKRTSHWCPTIQK